MADQTFKVGDRVKHIKIGRVGQVVYVYTKTLENTPGTGVQVYRIVFDNFLSTTDAYANEIEPESK